LAQVWLIQATKAIKRRPLSGSNPTIGLSLTETRKVFQVLAFVAQTRRDQDCKDEGEPPREKDRKKMIDLTRGTKQSPDLCCQPGTTACRSSCSFLHCEYIFGERAALIDRG
jgi:hypothetical protein